MRRTKLLVLAAFLILLPVAVFAQTPQLVGSWQLVKKSTCLEEVTTASQDSNIENLRKDMQSRTPPTTDVVSFKDNATGRETTRILNTDKASNPKKFYYKFNGKMLLILDKRSQTISDSYMVDKFTADSLIVSHSARPCEIRIFVKISEK